MYFEKILNRCSSFSSEMILSKKFNTKRHPTSQIIIHENNIVKRNIIALSKKTNISCSVIRSPSFFMRKKFNQIHRTTFLVIPTHNMIVFMPVCFHIPFMRKVLIQEYYAPIILIYGIPTYRSRHITHYASNIIH